MVQFECLTLFETCGTAQACTATKMAAPPAAVFGGWESMLPNSAGF